MTKLRLIAEEKMQLRYLEQAAKAEEENKKKGRSDGECLCRKKKAVL